MSLRSIREPLPLSALFGWLAVVVVALYTRPLLPIDETRYVSVAWEMWLREDFLVPYKNGAPYSHKPPLLFWLMHAGWWVFGVNELTPRLTGPILGLLNLFMTAAIAGKLWPDSKTLRLVSPLILLSFLLWTVFMSTTMFDMLLTFFVLLGVRALLFVRDGNQFKGWLFLALSLGGGVLAKGPVVFLFLLPLLLTVRYWTPRELTVRWIWWVSGSLLAIAVGAGIALCWALPAASAGGQVYEQAILWGQTAGRVNKAFAHQRPFWWYLPLLPLILLPWTFIGPLWAGLKKQLADPGSRFCLCWLCPPVLIFSLVSGKQMHYLLPLFPAMALLLARSVDLMKELPRSFGQKLVAMFFFLAGGSILALPEIVANFGVRGISFGLAPFLFGAAPIFCAGFWLWRWKPESPTAMVRGVSLLMVLLVGCLHLSLMDQMRIYYDFSPMAKEIAHYQDKGISIAHMDKYHDQYHFLGRLEKPLAIVRTGKQLQRWQKENPDGLVVYYGKGEFPGSHALFSQHFKLKKMVGLFPADKLLALLRYK